MKICVVGAGYVGLVAAVCFCELGHSVICVESDSSKVSMLNAAQAPIHEMYLPKLLQRHLSRQLTFTTDLHEAVRVSEVVFIAVGTPASDSTEADLSYVEAVARGIARAISDYTVIVEKSTVPVLTSELITRTIVLNGASPDKFEVVSNPEFLREGTAVVDFLYPDRIVIGSSREHGFEVMRSLYAPLTTGSYYMNIDAVRGPAGFAGQAQLLETSVSSAEMIKHASNAFLAMKISFINAVSNICESVGADIREVANGIGTDSRIGPGFLNPGIGYGGSCLPKDLMAFQAMAAKAGYDFRLLQEVSAINDGQQERFVNKVRSAFWTLKGKRLAVLGCAFKGGTDDIRKSPAIPIMKSLLRENCHLAVYDPAALERVRGELPPSEQITFCQSIPEAITGSDAMLILTDWQEFKALDLAQVRNLLRCPIIIDGRNMFEPPDVASHGIAYISMGRPDAFPVWQHSVSQQGIIRASSVKTDACAASA